MRILCGIAGHRPGGRILKNGRVEFGKCRRCGSDLLRRKGRAWKVPAGYRIVWPAGFSEVPARAARQEKAIPLADLSRRAAGQASSLKTGTASPAAKGGELSAGRRNIARISVYRPGPGEPDFMEDDKADRFLWQLRARPIVPAHRYRDSSDGHGLLFGMRRKRR